MSDLIDRGALMARFEKNCRICKSKHMDREYGGCSFCGMTDAIGEVKRAPTVDAEPVRHGYFIKEKIVTKTTAELQLVAWTYVCSECKMRLSILEAKKNYCPNCGAKMDKE